MIPASQMSKTEVHSDENTCPSHMGGEQLDLNSVLLTLEPVSFLECHSPPG